MLKKILIGLGVVVLGVFGFVMMQPSTSHIERSATVHAPRATVFALVNNMESRGAWYPWDRLDPDMKKTYSENKEGVGAWYTWAGNDKVGEGKQSIIEVVANEKVVDDLHFMVPMESKSIATFTLKDDGANTKVTWGLDSEEGFMTKVSNAFMDMDAMLGPDFENGLKYLDEVAIKKVADDAAAAKAAEAPVAEDAPIAIEGDAKEGT